MKLVQTLLFALISISVFGQEFQRMYRLSGDDSLEAIDAVMEESGSTYVLSRFNDEVDTVLALTLAKHDLKGDREWHIDISPEEGFALQSFGDMKAIGKDSFLITFSAKKDSLYYQAMLRTSASEIEWCYSYIQNPDDTRVSRPAEIAVRDTNTIYLATSRLDSTESMSVWQVDNTGLPTAAESNFVLSDTIQVDSLSQQFNSSFSEITYVEADTSIIVSGKMFDDTTALFVAKLDEELNQVWARSYALPQMEEGQIYEQLVTSSGDIILIGTARPDFYRGFVMSLDSLGNVNWYNTIFNSDPTAFGTYLFAGALSQEEDIVIGGTYLENFVYPRPFMIAFDTLGARQWDKQYNRAALQQLDLASGIPQTYEYLTIIEQGNIMAAPDGGFLFATTQQDDFSTLQRSGLLIKTDNEGNTFRLPGELSTCDEDINLVAGTTELIVDSLILVKTAIDSLAEEFTMVNDTLVVYTTPVLGFLSPVQCPDSINVELDATLLAASMYEWSTGDTTPVITVMDDEEYTVTVTFDTDFCFQLCDTFVAEVFPVVEGFINVDTDRWCTDREFELEAFATGGNGDYTYLWGGGETTKSVIRTDPDVEYSVQVTDECGQDSIFRRFIPLGIFEQPDNPTIDISCAGGSFILTIANAGIVDSTIVWSTGETGVQSIIVEEEDEYSVTFVDDCMYEVGATINTTDITSTELTSDISDYCSDGVIYLTAGLSPQDFFDTDNITWSTGANDDGKQSIIVMEHPATYSVTITDNCGNEFVNSVSIPDLSQEPEVVTLDAQCIATGWQYSIIGEITTTTTEWMDELGNILALGTDVLVLESAQTVIVTAIDDCQNEVTATVTAEQLASESMESIEININRDSICAVPQYFVLTANFSNGVLPSSLLWDTGETTQSITVFDAGTYGITAEDECGFVLADQVTINPEDFFEAPVLMIDVECGENETTLTASVTGDINSDIGYEWNTGVNDAVLTLIEGSDSTGVYTVSVVDICNDTISESVVLNRGDFDPCECVQWPNFMQFGGNTQNPDRDPSFGPVNNCGDLVNEYEMYIYNAYGNLLFETTSFDILWSGNNYKNGDLVPSGVYMYHSVYTIGEEKIEKKGDITLIR